jgi:hypothetical protein
VLCTDARYALGSLALGEHVCSGRALAPYAHDIRRIRDRLGEILRGP